MKKTFLISFIGVVLAFAACEDKGSGGAAPVPPDTTQTPPLTSSATAGAEGGPCIDGTKCGEGLVCNLEKILCEKPPAPTCSADTDCKTGYICQNGNCAGAKTWKQIAYRNPSDVYSMAAGQDGAVYVKPSYGLPTKTTDGGETWTRLQPLGGNRYIWQLVVSGNTIYATSGESLNDSSTYGTYGTNAKVVKSTDGGKNWSMPLNAGLTTDLSKRFNTLIASPEGNLFLGTADGIFKSVDGGENWQAAGLQGNRICSISLSNNAILATQCSGVSVLMYSGDGNTWRPLNICQAWNHFAIPGAFFVSTYEGRLLRSTGNFLDWLQKNNGLPPDRGRATSLVSDGGAVYVAFERGGVFKSTDLGDNWVAANNGLADLGVYSLLYNNNTLYVGTDFGVFKSVNGGGLWERAKNTIPGQMLEKTIVKDGNIFTITESGVFKTSDAGKNWIGMNEGFSHGIWISSLLADNESLYVGGNRGIVKRPYSADTWSEIDSSELGDGGWIYNILKHNGGLYAVFGYGHGIKKYVDGSGWSDTQIPDKDLFVLADDATTLYAGGEGIYKSADGVTWTALPFSGSDQVTSILPYKGALYAGSYPEGMSKSDDGGNTWSQINNGLQGITQPDYYLPGPGIYVTSLTSIGDSIFAGIMGSGVFESTDGGANWKPVGDNLADKNVVSLTSSGNEIYATTIDGIFLYVQ